MFPRLEAWMRRYHGAVAVVAFVLGLVLGYLLGSI